MGAIVVAAGLFNVCLMELRADEDSASWKSKAISSVANPVYFEEAQIRSDIRPLFMQHDFRQSLGSSNGPIPLGGDAQLAAVQLRWAVNDRLAFIATKHGYVDFNPANTLAPDEGLVDLAVGVKYALIDNAEHEYMLTAGLRLELPIGNTSVLQGNGKGEWNPFISALKGYGDFHLSGTLGARIPNDFADESSMLHYSLMADYYLHRYFIPFATVSAFTVLSEGNGLPLTAEGFDLVNFGASSASGTTQAAVGVGFRSRLLEQVDFGFAYEWGVTGIDDIFDKRATLDFVYHF